MINLGSIVQATDRDGDSVTGNANGLVITVDDDTPIATPATSTGTVDEDGVLEGAANDGPGDGIAGGIGDVAGEATVATGSVTGLFQSGADEPLTYGFAGTAVATLQALRPDLGRRCAELCGCCDHGDGVCAGRRPGLHVHAGPGDRGLDLHVG